MLKYIKIINTAGDVEILDYTRAEVNKLKNADFIELNRHPNSDLITLVDKTYYTTNLENGRLIFRYKGA